MSMYDTLEIKNNSLGLPWSTYQSKDLGAFMDEYAIYNDRLYLIQYEEYHPPLWVVNARFEEYTKERRGMTGLWNHWAALPIKYNRYFTPHNITTTLVVYRHDNFNDTFVEFALEIVRGHLVDVFP